MEWQPIKTAPRGAMPLLIYVPENRPERRILTASSTGGDEWWICSGSVVLGKPTHWMPLPASPAVS